MAARVRHARPRGRHGPISPAEAAGLAWFGGARPVFFNLGRNTVDMLPEAGCFGARDAWQNAERLVREAGGEIERLKALPENSLKAMFRRAWFYAQAGWNRREAETWFYAFHAASGEVIIPLLDAQIAAADGEANEALARPLEVHRAEGIE